MFVRAVSYVTLAFVIAFVSACGGSAEPVDTARGGGANAIPADDPSGEVPEAQSTAAPSATSPPNPTPDPTVAPAPTVTATAAATSTPEATLTPEPKPEPFVLVSESLLRTTLSFNGRFYRLPSGSREVIGLREVSAEPIISFNLPPLESHNALTVRFDLIVGGSWLGGTSSGDHSFRFLAGGRRVMTGTFSTMPDATQTWPNSILSGILNPAFTGATEVDTLGFARDSLYSFETTFAHDADQLNIRIEGWPRGDDAVFALDNLEVIGSTEPAENFKSEITVSMTPGGPINVVGTMPTEQFIENFNAILDAELDGREANVDVQVAGGVEPAWGPTIGRSIAGIADFEIENFEWNVTAFEGTVDGTAASEADRDGVMQWLFPSSNGFTLNGLLRVAE